MKKFKAFIVLLVVIFVALVVYQNRTYFFTKQALSLSLGVETWHWTAPEIANAYYFGGCFLIGMLVTGYMGLMSKMRSRKTIKGLNTTLNTHLQTIETLHMELDKFKSDPYFRKKSAIDAENADKETLENADEESVIELPANMEPSKA